MNARERRELDDHITGHGGEDQFEPERFDEATGPMPDTPAVTVHQPQQSKPPKGVTVWLAIAPLLGCPGRWSTSIGYGDRALTENTEIGLRRDAVIVEVKL